MIEAQGLSYALRSQTNNGAAKPDVLVVDTPVIFFPEYFAR
jgi:3-deoxy-D-manno-octulosonic-acid transferase